MNNYCGIIVCLAVICVSSIHACCSNQNRKWLSGLRENKTIEMENIYNEKVENPIAESFMNDLINKTLSILNVSTQIPVAQFEHCQSLIKSQLSSAVRQLQDNQMYKMIEDNLDFFLQKREDFINESRKEFQEMVSYMLSLESNDCSDKKKVADDYELFDKQYYLLGTEIVPALQKFTVTCKDLSDRAMKLQKQAMENAVAELKSRDDIKSCLA